MIEFRSTTVDGLSQPDIIAVAEPTTEQLEREQRARDMDIDVWFLEEDNLAAVCKHMLMDPVQERERVVLLNKIVDAKILDDIAALVNFWTGELDILDTLSESDLDLIRLVQEVHLSVRQDLELESESESGTSGFPRILRRIGALASGAIGGGSIALAMANMTSAGIGAAIGAGVIGGVNEIIQHYESKTAGATEESASQYAQQLESYADRLADRLRGMLSAKTYISGKSIQIDFDDNALKKKPYDEFKEIIKAERKHLKEVRRSYEPDFRERVQDVIYSLDLRSILPDDREGLILEVEPAADTLEMLERLADVTRAYEGESLAALWHSGLKQKVAALVQAADGLNGYRRRYEEHVSKIDDIRGRKREYGSTYREYQAGLQQRQTQANLAVFAFLRYQQELVLKLQNHTSSRDQSIEQTWPTLPSTQP